MAQSTDGLVAGAQRIMRINSAYFQSKVLQSAAQIGLFDYLAKEPATAGEICRDLDLHPRLLGDFLDALVGLALLGRDGDRYHVDASAVEYLTSAGDLYIGGTSAQHGRMHYHAWGQLTDALRDGKARSKKIDGTEGFLKFYENAEIVHALMDHMDTFTGFVAPGILGCLDWRRYTSFVDVGGARGNLAALLVKDQPHLRGMVFDLPPVGPLFDEHMRHLGCEGKVTFHAGDFFNAPIPPADVLMIGHTLHDWPTEDRRTIVERTYAAVNPGGALLIYDAMLDDERRDPGELLQSLNCRLLGTGASEYTIAECREYVENAGFRFDSAVAIPTITNDKIVIARKD
jgi:hypothetical protein